MSDWKRKKVGVLNLLLSCLLVFPFFTFYSLEGSAAPKDTNMTAPIHVPGEFIIKYKDGEIPFTLSRAVSNEIEVLEVFDEGMQHIRINEPKNSFSSRSTATILSSLKNDPNIEFVQPNFMYYSRNTVSTIEQTTPSWLPSENFDELWGLHNTGQTIHDPRSHSLEGTAGMDIDMLKAWTITKGDPNVIVMVPDDGVDISHQEFAGRIIQDDTLNPQDDFYYGIGNHGTHVAGTIAAADNGKGIIGVAPQVKILPVAHSFYEFEEIDYESVDLEGFQFTTSDIIGFIQLAKQMEVKVVNASWGSYVSDGNDIKPLHEVTEEDVDRALYESIASVQDDILFVVAAGNYNLDHENVYSMPDSFGTHTVGQFTPLSNVISVAAADNQGMITDFSDYGKSVHLAAPGWAIKSTIVNNRYDWYSGTSMAAPHISGVAALMYSLNPGLTPEEVITIMMETGRSLPEQEKQLMSMKMVNAHQALQRVIEKMEHPPVSIEVSPNYVYFEEGEQAKNIEITLQILTEGTTFTEHTNTKMELGGAFSSKEITDWVFDANHPTRASFVLENVEEGIGTIKITKDGIAGATSDSITVPVNVLPLIDASPIIEFIVVDFYGDELLDGEDVEQGTVLTVFTDDLGTVYFVPKGEYPNKAALEEAVQANVGTKAEIEEMGFYNYALIETKGFPLGEYQVQVVTNDGYFSSPIYLSVTERQPPVFELYNDGDDVGNGSTILHGSLLEIVLSQEGLAYLVQEGDYNDLAALEKGIAENKGVKAEINILTYFGYTNKLLTENLEIGNYQLYIVDSEGTPLPPLSLTIVAQLPPEMFVYLLTFTEDDEISDWEILDSGTTIQWGEWLEIELEEKANVYIVPDEEVYDLFSLGAKIEDEQGIVLETEYDDHWETYIAYLDTSILASGNYQIIAVNEQDLLSEPFHFTLVDPLQPSGLASTQVGKNAILSWDAIEGVEYKVYDSTYQEIEATIVIEGGLAKVTLTDLQPNIEYYFFVKAFDSHSHESTFTPFPPVTIIERDSGETFIQEIADISRVVLQGDVKFTLPTTVIATMSDGSTQAVPVSWAPSTIDVTSAGETTLEGTIEGYAKKVSLSVTVLEVKTPEIVTEDGKRNVSFENGATLSNIPDGSSIKGAEVPEEVVKDTGATPVGTVMKIDFDGVVPEEGIRLKLPLNEDADDDVSIAYFNDDNNRWERVVGSEVITEADKRFVVATVHHFSMYGAIQNNVTLIANSITAIENPAQDATTLTLPTVPPGYTISIKSSSQVEVIAEDGVVVPPASSTNVTLIFVVSKNSESADTVPITVIVPAKSTTTTSPTGGSSSSGTRTTSTLVNISEESKVRKDAVEILFPKDAFPSNFSLKIEKVDEKTLPISDDKKLVSDIVEITKDKEGLFSKKIKISLSFDREKVDLENESLGVFWLDENDNKWIMLENIIVDVDSGKVSGEIDHFTKFAVLAYKKEAEVTNPLLNLTDIKGHWAERYIHELLTKEVMNGYPDATFRPNNSITRAEFATALVRALQLTKPSGKVFADTVNHWAREYIDVAYGHGIIQGYNEQIFAPDEFISREQMAMMIVRATNLYGSSDTNVFLDDATIAAWAREAVSIATKYELMNGYPDNTFKPKENASRAEAATVIIRALNVYDDYQVLFNQSYPLSSEQLKELPKEIQQWIEQQGLEEFKGTKQVGNSTYILITRGQKNTGGYGMELTAIQNVENKDIIEVTYTNPALNQSVPNVITYPIMLLKVNRLTEIDIEIK